VKLTNERNAYITNDRSRKKTNRNAYNKTYCVYLLPNIYLLYIYF